MRAIAGKLNSGADKRNTTNNETDVQRKRAAQSAALFFEISMGVCGLYRNQMLVRGANGPVITIAADESGPGWEFRRANQIGDFRNRLFGLLQRLRVARRRHRFIRRQVVKHQPLRLEF
jgi:hypothetical protein